MATTTDKTAFRILVAGFGSVSHVQPRDLPNPAFEIIKRLPSSTLPPTTHGDAHLSLEIVAHPVPLPSSYHGLLHTIPALVRGNVDAVDLVLLIGVAVGQEYYSVEQSARRDGYHEVPDLERRTLAKGEGVKVWGRKSSERLATSVDLAAVVEAWHEELARVHYGQGKKSRNADEAGRPKHRLLPEVRHTDDVGSYVCGLVYYAMLAELVRITEETPGKMNVEGKAVFLHAPLLLGEEQLEIGYGVVMALIKALGMVASSVAQ
ncbi:uncharacterized protein PG986_000676 [Apiospora aurea]|uniref:Peptidase C15, pyroglutamyl peptidase I-like protein n=1 Tax=Apiospora aurea TaxID=335848 RepID=A0ABR1QUR7_9PEZI